MNRKELILLLLGVLVVGGIGLAVYNRNASSWHQSNAIAGGKALKEFPLNDVAQIQIKSANSELNLVKKDDRWTVKERGDYPANFEQVSDLVRKLWELKAVREVKAGPSQFGRLNLLEPGANAKSAESAKSAGTLVDLKNDKGARVAALLLGKTYSLNEGDSEMGGFPAGRYVLPLESKQPVLVSEPFSQADQPAPQWLDRDFFKIDRLRSVAVTGSTAETSWKLTRESETADWKLEGLKPEEQMEQSKTSGIGSQLAFPTFVDVVADAKKANEGMEKPTVIEAENFDGFHYTIKLGAAQGENLPLQFTVSATLPKERVAGKDEKPEDKTRLDKQFADKQKELQAKLEKEKKIEGRTFLVAKSSFEGLMKKRSEFLGEKKAPETAASATSPVATPALAPAAPPVAAPVPGVSSVATAPIAAPAPAPATASAATPSAPAPKAATPAVPEKTSAKPKAKAK